MSRFGRAMTLYTAWYIPLIFGSDILWFHFTHHDMPTWLWATRLGAWMAVVMFNKVPGYKRFVGLRGARGKSSSDVVPESPSGPVVGWRAWRRSPYGLTSLTTATIWPHLWPYEAWCPLAGIPNHGTPPGPACRCGIYVFADPVDARNIRLGVRFAVYGPVLTWGRTQVHETGWRAEYAQPLALVRHRVFSRKRRKVTDLWLERLGRQYGIPVLSHKEAVRLAERFESRG